MQELRKSRETSLSFGNFSRDIVKGNSLRQAREDEL